MGAMRIKQVPVGYVPQFAMLNRKFPISLLEVVFNRTLKAGTISFLKYSSKDEEIRVRAA
jgi:zinc transport system ATP-binding protein